MGSVGKMNGSSSIDLYRKFIEGQSYAIHEGSEKDKKELDKLFKPSEKEMTVYKGIPVTQADLNNLSQIVTSYSSTSLDNNVAKDYASRAYDLEDGDYVPLQIEYSVAKGTPIVDTRKTLGTTGMKSYEKEITIGRNVVYKYDKPVKHIDKHGDEYYTVKAYVKRRRK